MPTEAFEELLKRKLGECEATDTGERVQITLSESEREFLNGKDLSMLCSGAEIVTAQEPGSAPKKWNFWSIGVDSDKDDEPMLVLEFWLNRVGP